MARDYNSRDLWGANRPTSGPMPLSGLIPLRPGRNRKGNKLWRPLEFSDIRGENDLGDFDADEALPFGTGREPGSFFDMRRASPPHFDHPSHLKSSPLDLPTIQTTVGAKPGFGAQSITTAMNLSNNDQSAVPSEDSEEISPTDTRHGVVENYLRLFGHLPDLIRLHEQTGDFDGQIVFIGHPNRDVSAHQWSSASFQWVNIGQWAHSRGKIEGSLASDRIASTTFALNSIEHFKMAAENREKRIKEFGRSKEERETVETRSALDIADQNTFPMSAPGSPNEAFTSLKRTSGNHGTPDTGSSTRSTFRNVTTEQLEDPFVTPPKLPRPYVPASFVFNGLTSGAIGSMDFDYEFPTKLVGPSGLFGNQGVNATPQQLHAQRKHDHVETTPRHSLLRERETSAQLREVGFGEEASSAFTTPTARMNSSRPYPPLSPQDVHNRQILRDRLAELSDQARRPSLQTEPRIAIPDVPMLNTNIRALFPPGPTVANPYRGVSTLNANAAPYTAMPTATLPTEESVSDMTTVPHPSVTNLYFSDPDGARQAHAHQVANGLNQQAPTKQNWNGPFFAESMPTTHDLTASLTVPVSDEEKLVNWFNDGQRPARQQEYAKSLMAAASARKKTRNFGAIGDNLSRGHVYTEYENTPLFVRLYENLSPYVEAFQAGRSSDYFTRAWKPAPQHQRDQTPEGNASFFSGAPATTVSPQLRRASNRPRPMPQGSPWGGTRPFDNLLAAKFKHGVAASGKFGSSGAGGH